MQINNLDSAGYTAFGSAYNYPSIVQPGNITISLPANETAFKIREDSNAYEMRKKVDDMYEAYTKSKQKEPYVIYQDTSKPANTFVTSLCLIMLLVMIGLMIYIIAALKKIEYIQVKDLSYRKYPGAT